MIYVFGLIKNEKQYFKMGDKHHELHAALAFYNSGFDSAVALIVDGAGTFIQLGEGITGYEFESIFKVDLLYRRWFENRF